MKKLRVGIEGGAGFTGGELIRLLLAHPKVEIAAATSSTFPGQPVFLAHPNLRGRTNLTFTRKLDYKDLDVLFLAGGHGDAMAEVPAIVAQAGSKLRIIDLSGDFRLKDQSLYPAWYAREHKAPALLKKFAYGLVELNREEIKKAKWIANPGCFATATALALGPLAKGGVGGVVSVTAITGSSGSGASASPITHHPTRHANLKAYKPFTHQHIPEIEQILESLAGKKGLRLSLVPISGPFARGIYAVCQVDLPKGWTAAQVKELFASAYKGSEFVRLVPEPPSLNAVNGSNHCDVFVTVQEGRICVISAIDNLVKGASGQAVQNLNVMMGWNEAVGLEFAGHYP
ncbi:MAG: N-acetyl-gamma-glutamyl-phosphate reductase [Elusimicrobiota bacterium]|nr:MAG: N-acetyl-gamma-glutamyl-phosphate reductase [Elusimicrobiota bacterium]